MTKYIKTFSSIFIFLIIYCDECIAWKGKTHKELTKNAISASDLSYYFEKKLGFDINIKYFKGPSHSQKWDIEEFSQDEIFRYSDWITHGAEAEDEFITNLQVFFKYGKNIRSVNHFYNPFWDCEEIYPFSGNDTIDNWHVQEGGLYDSLIILNTIDFDLAKGKPLPRWCYDGCLTDPPSSTFQREDKNHFSWVMARKYFYAALVGDNTEIDGIGGIVGKAEMNENERDRCYALLFRSIGQLVHLLQDAGVPEHTRNDAHPLSGENGFENYASKKDFSTNSWSTYIPWKSIVKSEYPLFDFFDANRTGEGYDGNSTGLAEFSNYNFLTKDSIIDNLWCIESPFCSPFGDQRRRIFTSPRIDKSSYLIEDGACYFLSAPISDPLAIKPSETIKLAKKRWYYNLLQLMAWGDYTTEDDKIWDDYCNMLAPKSIAYSAALIDYFFRGTIDINLSQDVRNHPVFRIDAKNTSFYGEEMNSGTIELVIRYEIDGNTEYIVVPEQNGVRTISRDDFVELNFDLSSNPVPMDASNIFLQVVYKGILGQEPEGIGLGGSKNLYAWIEPWGETLTENHQWTYEFTETSPYFVCSTLGCGGEGELSDGILNWNRTVSSNSDAIRLVWNAKTSYPFSPGSEDPIVGAKKLIFKMSGGGITLPSDWSYSEICLFLHWTDENDNSMGRVELMLQADQGWYEDNYFDDPCGAGGSSPQSPAYDLSGLNPLNGDEVQYDLTQICNYNIKINKIYLFIVAGGISSYDIDFDYIKFE